MRPGRGDPLPSRGRGLALRGAPAAQGPVEAMRCRLCPGTETLARLEALAHEIGTVCEPAQAVGAHWKSSEGPGPWSAVERRFRDGHTETWWALGAECGPFGAGWHRCLVVATTDPQQLPDLSTWYLETNLPHPDAPIAQPSSAEAKGSSAHRAASPAEVVRLYGLRNWVEQGYDKQVKHGLGWADSR